ncbi:MAG: hypothetical protein HP006_06835 [Alistipes sp.]|nr:hypothetical protein [Alistipes sp.]
MQTSQKNSAGNPTDMLAAFDRIQVHTQENITQADHEFCRQQQELLYATLDQLMKWYDLFRKDAEQYIESHRPSFEASGKVETRERYNEGDKSYSEYEFLPFSQINTIVKNYSKACRNFAYRIISYFNKQYNLSIPTPNIYDDPDELPWGFRPDYMSCIEIVFDHLGGRGFREKAEDEIIDRCLETVRKYRNEMQPKLKGQTISFTAMFRFSDYTPDRICYEDVRKISNLCTALALFGDQRLNGEIGIIQQFDADKVDTSRWYDLTTSDAEQIRFYKNGRIDVRFANHHAAQLCFHQLRLDTLTDAE